MRLIWIEDARVGDGWSAHLEDEPDTTLFIAPELHHGRYLLQGAFVPDSHEMSREYGTLAAAQEQALLYLTSWIARRNLIESRMHETAQFIALNDNPGAVVNSTDELEGWISVSVAAFSFNVAPSFMAGLVRGYRVKEGAES